MTCEIWDQVSGHGSHVARNFLKSMLELQALLNVFNY